MHYEEREEEAILSPFPILALLEKVWSVIM